ncbi:hypothetical protein GCM10020331_072630 [Ectobacillus funiculus]
MLYTKHTAYLWREHTWLNEKVGYNAASTNNQTPKESLPAGQMAMEFASENVAKYANRNSKKRGKKEFLF